ncbi:hypothetical protein GUITHDRAFT_150246 [Guillardia theta CCMP2712]|uniref:Uncharacterized protein n=1 Tax=Guillardia theta (strain CCMP2712) TaxID=905079 RepID=L1JZW0_GUITC|nr:hypothetical protein GUITHDRAFT_150246 [Guillardia theta CCMP2712]EKX53658.1 hypothetical protein GUITHDRAFT_150246 [Guillardia theta CCMP2712]|eukprot:XP_005840638.1 hypothetical protein GUITHDRAFT_150246 [Guillardia theta CCMP2712]
MGEYANAISCGFTCISGCRNFRYKRVFDFKTLLLCLPERLITINANSMVVANSAPRNLQED